MPKSDNRQQIRDVIGSVPGIHLRGVQKVVGLSFSTVRHHVGKLEKSGDVERLRLGRYDRLFPRGLTDLEKAVASIMFSRSTVSVLRELGEPAGVTNKQISSATGLAKSTVSKHAKILSEMGLVKKIKGPQSRTRYAVRDDAVTEALARTSAGFRLAVNRYIDLWDF